MESLTANLPAALKTCGIPEYMRKKEAGFEAFGMADIGEEIKRVFDGHLHGWGITLHAKNPENNRRAFLLTARLAILNFHSVRNVDTSALYLGIRDESSKEQTIAKVSYPTEIVHGKCPLLMIRNGLSDNQAECLPVGFTRWLAERAIEWIDEGGGVVLESSGTKGEMEKAYGPLFTSIFSERVLTV